MPINVNLTIIATCHFDIERFLSLNAHSIRDIERRQDIELIIVDTSGSNFQIKTNIYETISNYHNITLIRTDNKEKQAFGRNLGLKYSKGSYIWFVDSDDIFQLPNSDIYSNFFADVISFNFIYNDSQGKNNLKINGSNKLNRKSILFALSTNRIANSCWPYFYSKNFLIMNEIKFENMFFEDLIFNLKCFLVKGITYQHVSFNLYKYIFNSQGVSRLKNLDKKKNRFQAAIIATNLIFKNKNLLKIERFILASLYLMYHGIWCNL